MGEATGSELGNHLSMEDMGGGDHVGVPGSFSSQPVHIGWKQWGPVWFPGLPLALIFLIALILSTGWIQVVFALLAITSIGLLILRLIVLLGNRQR